MSHAPLRNSVPPSLTRTQTGMRLCTSTGTGGWLPANTSTSTSRLTVWAPSLTLAVKTYSPGTLRPSAWTLGTPVWARATWAPGGCEATDQA